MGNQFTCLWQDREVPRKFTTAVSLHGHTNRSKESLYFMGEFVNKRPLLRYLFTFVDREAQRKSAIKADLWKAYWTPPLPPLQAFNVERNQIDDLGKQHLISLTDHDSIEAPLLLRVVPEARRIPVSLEWSVPLEGTIFHLGVHNLPTAEAKMWVDRMAAFTARPDPRELRDLLAALSAIPQSLIVFNHPLWDLPSVGMEIHRQALRQMKILGGEFLHALELGGLRSWSENREVIQLARAFGLPFIAGGDRHGCEPSALLNLTNASSFSEFAEEVRNGHSNVLAMPQYAECTNLRVYHTVLDVIRYYPDHPIGVRYWDERVYHHDSKGVHRPLCMLWDGPPLIIPPIFSMLSIAESGPIRRALEFAFNRGQQELSTELEAG